MGFMSVPSGDGGGFDTYIKYNGKAGRWYTKPDGGGEEYEVTNMTAIFDFDNLQTGWVRYTPGAAPEKVLDPSLSQAAPKPGDDFKRAFFIRIFSDKNIGGVREFSSTAGVVIDAMNKLYDAWNTSFEPGKLPVVKCTGVSPVTNKHGTNYAPKLEIVQWADRPAELGEAKVGTATKADTAPANHVPPPSTAGDDTEF